MDGKSVWPGFDYAWTQYPSKNKEYYEGASRVKAIATLERVEPHNTRNTTFVKVIRLTPEGEIRMKREWDDAISEYREVEYLDEVRARELFMRWDEYEDETEVRNARKAERELEQEREREKRQREREEREREENERRLQAERERAARHREISDGLMRVGLQGTIDEYSQRVTMSFEDFLQWLNSLEKVDCLQCDRKLVRIPSS